MSDVDSAREQVRPEVVAAIVTALQETDPSNLPADATRAEKDAAKDQYLTGLVAGRGHPCSVRTPTGSLLRRRPGPRNGARTPPGLPRAVRRTARRAR